MRTPPQITREELYEKVWTTPMVALAEEFGISDVALAKRCRRWNIPCPPRGYWAKLAAGRNPQRSQLPPGPEPVARLSSNLPDPSESVGAVYAFPKDGKRLHPAARQLQDLLKGSTPGSDRRLSINSYLAPITHLSAPLTRFDQSEKFLNIRRSLGPFTFHTFRVPEEPFMNLSRTTCASASYGDHLAFASDLLGPIPHVP